MKKIVSPVTKGISNNSPPNASFNNYAYGFRLCYIIENCTHYFRIPLLALGQAYDSLTRSAPHYSDVIMSAMVSLITGVSIVYSIVRSGAEQANIKAPRDWPLWEESIGDFPAQRSSNAENGSVWWRHHEY